MPAPFLSCFLQCLLNKTGYHLCVSTVAKPLLAFYQQSFL